jgi:hypothetical protein
VVKLPVSGSQLVNAGDGGFFLGFRLVRTWR